MSFDSTLQIVVLLAVVMTLFSIIFKRVILAKQTTGGELSDYLFAHSKSTGGLDGSTTMLTAIASNFQTANALFVGLWFGYNFGFAIAVLSLFFASGVWLLYYLVRDLSDKQKKAVLQNKLLPYERIFAPENKRYSYYIAVLIYLSVIFAAVTEVWFGSRMAADIILPIVNAGAEPKTASADLLVPLTAALLAVFLLVYVYFGGYRAVAETDRIQTALIFAMLTILIVGVILNTASNLADWSWGSFTFGVGNFYSNYHYMISLFCGGIALNVFWQLVLPTQWQRAAAANSAKTYVDSLPGAGLGTLLTWSAPVLIGAMSAAANGATAGGVPTAFQGWLDLASAETFGSYVTGIVVAVVLGIAVAGIFSAALSTADTSIIIVVTKLVQVNNWGDGEFDLVRRRASMIVFVVFLLAGFLYWLDPPIDKLIFAVSTAQLFFAGYFWRYIKSGGSRLIDDSGRAIATIVCFAAFFALALVVNLVPAVSAAFPNFGFWLPVIALFIGVWMSNGLSGHED